MSSTPRTTNRPMVILAVMASMAMVAIEATIVATVMPQIASQLGGLSLYSWVFASFLLAQTAMTVVFGKLSDIYGRRPVILVGIAIFLIGSLAAGFAWSMPAMIAFRLIQGIGAGAIQPVSLTIVGDLYPVQERGKVQGYLASVWAVSAVLGPMLGALIVTRLSWSWIFWMNVPIGLAAAGGFWLYLREAPVTRRASIDLPGALLFTAGIASLMICLTESGLGHTTEAWSWAGVFVIVAVLFIFQERRVADPMVSFELWSRRIIATVNGSALLTGMALIGVTSFLPMYVQVVLGQSPVVAGLALTMVMLGWPIGATIASRSFMRVGLRRLMLIGSMLVPAGAAVFALLHSDGSPTSAGIGSFLMGLGMGLLSLCSLILIQESVAMAQRGSATASNIFSRNLGSALGATFFGAVFNFGLVRHNGGISVPEEQLRDLLQGTAVSGIGEAGLRLAVGSSLHLTFVVMLAMSGVILALALLLPRQGMSVRAVEAR
ncbi:MDR family MFS transporter [Variovorax sp. YR216]|uniref:MDR family MFS transporter n=1 Tax=Variovorax sp. YR216 TaxID=1882828 RepID=UPI0015A3E6BC|nr:MDR family MFS transporter [Variovorax sp. YR216]